MILKDGYVFKFGLLLFFILFFVSCLLAYSAKEIKTYLMTKKRLKIVTNTFVICTFLTFVLVTVAFKAITHNKKINQSVKQEINYNKEEKNQGGSVQKKEQTEANALQAAEEAEQKKDQAIALQAERKKAAKALAEQDKKAALIAAEARAKEAERVRIAVESQVIAQE